MILLTVMSTLIHLVSMPSARARAKMGTLGCNMTSSGSSSKKRKKETGKRKKERMGQYLGTDSLFLGSEQGTIPQARGGVLG